ncbi:MAG TPA: MFS transporter [Solirubrobacteraceae bacterium]|nr:MFS transporter [Solirubrobacteraceae bacterium]
MSAAAATASRGATGSAAGGEAQAPARHSLLLTLCCLAQFMVILDVSIVNVAIPSIHASLGFSQAELQWVINAYTITFAGFLMLSGRAADLFGQRRTFVTGLLVFALASLAGGTALSQQALIGARALQGLGGAIMAAASLAIITSSFAPGPERFRAIGLWGAMNGAGGATGTLLGGIITQELSWRWVLLINLPIGIAAALIARVVVAERRREAGAGGFDLGGALAITGGMLALVYGIVNAGNEGWGSPAALGPIVLGLVLLGAFALIESRVAQAPLVPLRVFASQPLRVANGVVLLFSAALFPMWYFTTLYMQEVLRMPPLGAGLAFLPMALTIMACATRAGALVGRFGIRPVLGFGLTLMAVGFVLFGALIEVNSSYGASVLIPGLFMAVGIGFTVVPSTIAATVSAKPGEAGLASGLVNTSRQMGGALGLAILASLGAQFTSHLINVDFRSPLLALTDGFRLAYLLGAVLCGVAAAITFKLVPKLPARAPSEPAGEAPAPGRAAAAVAAPAQAPASSVPGAPRISNQVSPDRVAQPPASGNGNVQPSGGPVPPPAEGAPIRPTRAAVEPPVASVVFSLSGERSWPVAVGSMTIRFAGAGERARRES